MAMLGFQPVSVRDVTSISLWSFPTFRRDLADPPPISTRAVTWYLGEHEGVAIVVRPTILSPTAIFSTVVAEIDPPLFAGLRVYPRGLIPFFGAHPDIRISRPAFDRKFVVQSFDERRVALLLGDEAAHPLLNTLVAELKEWPVVRDRFIELFDSADLDPASDNGQRLAERIAKAAALARLISARSNDLPERAEEGAARESWAHCALTAALSFDRRRWRMWGQLNGLDVEVSLGGAPPSVVTTLRVAFRYPLACGLYMRRGVYVKTGLFERSKKPGYKELDSILLIDERDTEKRKALLADAALRKKIADEANRSNLVITDRAITTTHATFINGHDILARLNALGEIAQRLAPPQTTMGPFR